MPSNPGTLLRVCVSLSLGMPWARLDTRYMFWDKGIDRRRDGRGRCRLSHQSIRDLVKWKHLDGMDMDGRFLLPVPPEAAMYTVADDVGYGRGRVGATPKRHDLRG